MRRAKNGGECGSAFVELALFTPALLLILVGARVALAGQAFQTSRKAGGRSLTKTQMTNQLHQREELLPSAPNQAPGSAADSST